MIKSSNIAIFSDIHIGVHRDSPVWHKITLDWVKWFKNTVDSRGIKDIVFCGDFYHYRDSIATNTISHSAKVLNELKDYNITFIPGNHDCYYKESSSVNSLSIFDGRDNITVLDKTTTITTDGGKKISFIPWGTSEKDIPKSDILFGHFEIESFKLNSFKICDHGIKTSDILKKSPLTFTGHFHLRSERKLKKGQIIYVGNPFQMDFGDAGDTKGIYFVDLDTNNIDFIENNISPRFYKIFLSEIAEKKVPLADLKKIVKGNIIKFIIDKRISTKHSEFLFKQFRALQPIQIEVEHDINFNTMIDEEGEHDFSGIDMERAITEFINIMDIDNNEPVVQYVNDLYKRVTH
jgi:DNA repair exonuclease SbcCD nuclease subunit